MYCMKEESAFKKEKKEVIQLQKNLRVSGYSVEVAMAAVCCLILATNNKGKSYQE